MNPNGATLESEFVFRRLSESFSGFATDVWASVPKWLLLVLVAAAVGRVLVRLTIGRAAKPAVMMRATALGRLATAGAICLLAIVLLGYVGNVVNLVTSPSPSVAAWLGIVPIVLAGLPALYLWLQSGERPTRVRHPAEEIAATAAGTAGYLIVLGTLVNLFGRDVIGHATSASEAFGQTGSLNSLWWFAFTGGLFAVGVAFVVAMYVKDHRAIAWYWAVLLATLRIAVYGILLGVFLLPSIQTFERTEKRSRVLMLLDVSPSMTKVSDDLSADASQKTQTRIQKVIDFLTDDKVAFLQNLTKQNPVHVYRFGTRLDEETQTFAPAEPNWAKAEWEAFTTYDFKPWLLRGLTETGKNAVRFGPAFGGEKPGNAEWAIDWFKKPDAEVTPPDLSPEDAARFKENREKLEKRIDVARAIVQGTNVPDSLTAAVNRESTNMVQGLIVLSDGRSNLGSDSSYTELKERAAREQIPVFTIAVGEDRQTVAITITDIVAPDRAPPDEPFKISVEADGVNLANQEVEVTLALYLPTRDPKKDPPDHELTAKLAFQPGDPPHGAAEFVIDPAKLPEVLTEESKEGAGPKRKLKNGAWTAIAKIAKDKREAFAGKEHVRERAGIQVIKRPLRVLLVASGPTREYQTLKTMFVREVAENRAELSILMQNEGGSKGEIVQDILPERLLVRFPTVLDTTGNTPIEEKYYNLNEYDLIVAFDPDWSELSEQQVKNLQTWVDNLGGGLILVADTHNLFQLARAEANSRLSPLLNILPVIPDDVIVQQTRPIPRTPRRLYLHPAADFDVLKLDEDAGSDDPIAGWERFFTKRDKYSAEADLKKELNPARGFFSSYPVKMTKPGAQVLAEFADVDEKGDKALRPWLVTTQPARGRTAFLGSGEMYRMRALDPEKGPEFYQRFWIKLARYVSANRDVKAARGRVLLNKEYISGSPIRVQARLLAPNGSPYAIGAIDPKFRIVPYTATGERIERTDSAGQKAKVEYGPFVMKPKPGAGEFDGYYQGEVTADARDYPPGDTRYRVVLEVPESSGDTLESEFMIRKSDPELDQARPDFAALLLLASEFDAAVQGRILDPVVRQRLLEQLPKDAGKPKLAFRLADRDKLALIPACMKGEERNFRNRGPVKDLWDEGVTLPMSATSWFSAGPVTVGYVLLAIVGLLSLEWLMRKLLRLA